MKKNKQIVTTIIIAIAFALAAGVSLFFVLSPKRTTMYVFNGTYNAGTQITSNMLTPLQADSNIVLAGARAGASDFFVTDEALKEILDAGDSLRINVTEGTAFMKSMLSVGGGTSIEMNMSPSKIAMTVAVDGVKGVTNSLAPGAAVNVYITDSNAGSYLLFENMRLLEVFKDKNDNLTGATLELSNEQALQLLDSSVEGSIYLGLVNGNGYQYTNTPDTVDKEAPLETPAETQAEEEQSPVEGEQPQAEGEAESTLSVND